MGDRWGMARILLSRRAIPHRGDRKILVQTVKNIVWKTT